MSRIRRFLSSLCAWTDPARKRITAYYSAPLNQTAAGGKSYYRLFQQSTIDPPSFCNHMQSTEEEEPTAHPITQRNPERKFGLPVSFQWLFYTCRCVCSICIYIYIWSSRNDISFLSFGWSLNVLKALHSHVSLNNVFFLLLFSNEHARNLHNNSGWRGTFRNDK